MEEKIYGGTFRVLDKEYSGQVRYLEEKYLILELHLPKAIMDNNELNLQNINIHGKTVTGSEITLYNCNCVNRHSYISYGKTIVTFNCEYLIWGKWIEPNIKTLYAELENAVVWSGLSGLTQKYYDDEFFDTIRFKKNDGEQIKFKDFSVHLYTKYKNELGCRPIPEKGEISERLIVKIEANKNKPIDEFINIIKERTLNLS